LGALPYFIEWYKSGSRSDIDKNSVFWAYRTQSVKDSAASGIPYLGTLNGPIADKIYVTANLVQPGTLTVTLGTLTASFNLSPGSTDVQAPFMDGNPPVFNFTPNDKDCAALIGSGRDPIEITLTPRLADPLFSTTMNIIPRAF
jgi:hypothetical protein